MSTPTIIIAAVASTIGTALLFALVFWINSWAHETRYKTISEVQRLLRDLGMGSCNLILGIDFTKSNERTGRRTFKGRCLHWVDPEYKEENPYQSVIRVLGRTLEPFDEDNNIPVFGFGDATTLDHSVFPFYAGGRECHGFKQVLQRYHEIVEHVTLSGPTTLGPIIRQAIQIVEEKRSFHILVVIMDGTDTHPRKDVQFYKEKETRDAVIAAADYPLSIVLIGVGDGPFGFMAQLDDLLPKRLFDNFQFVDFSSTRTARYPDVMFAVQALEEIPDQYKEIRKLGLLKMDGAMYRRLAHGKVDRGIHGVQKLRSVAEATAFAVSSRRGVAPVPPVAVQRSHVPRYGNRGGLRLDQEEMDDEDSPSQSLPANWGSRRFVGEWAASQPRAGEASVVGGWKGHEVLSDIDPDVRPAMAIPGQAQGGGQGNAGTDGTSIESAQLCKVCMDGVASVVFLPCRHICSCVDCSKKVRCCPICRASIEDSIVGIIS